VRWYQGWTSEDWAEVRWVVGWITLLIFAIMCIAWPIASFVSGEMYWGDMRKICRVMVREDDRLMCYTHKGKN
jgi:hypothetical protein